LIRKWDLYYSEESCKIMVDNLELSVSIERIILTLLFTEGTHYGNYIC